MSSALLPFLVIAALLTTSLSVAAQSTDTDITTDDAPISDQPLADQDAPEATPTPAVVYLVATATPTPTVAPTNTPVTGLKSEQDLRNELGQAGCQGPWDLGALHRPVETPSVNGARRSSPSMARSVAQIIASAKANLAAELGVDPAANWSGGNVARHRRNRPALSPLRIVAQH